MNWEFGRKSLKSSILTCILVSSNRDAIRTKILLVFDIFFICIAGTFKEMTINTFLTSKVCDFVKNIIAISKNYTKRRI